MSPDTLVISLADGQLGGSGSDFVIVEWTDSGDSDWDWIAPLHVHHRDDEAWYVLEGTLLVRYLLVMTPKIQRLVQALHEPGPSDYAAIFRAHDSELLI